MKLILDEDTLGITGRSLKALRDEIARRADHELLVLEISTSDITCGYLVVDRTASEAVFTGDGFRTDGGGEGSAGYRASQVILKTFGLRPCFSEPVAMDEAYVGDPGRAMDMLSARAKAAAEELQAEFVVPSQKAASYLRGYLR